METKIAIEGLKQLIRELAQEKYQQERNGMAKAALDFVGIIENQVYGVIMEDEFENITQEASRISSAIRYCYEGKPYESRVKKNKLKTYGMLQTLLSKNIKRMGKLFIKE